MNILLTGATGHLGTHITEQAIEAQIPHFHIGVRNTNKVPDEWTQSVNVRMLDYFDKDKMVKAFENIDLVIFIPSIIHPSFKRLPEVENLVAAAQEAQVSHIMFIGYYADQHNNPFHMSPYFGYAERLLASSPIDYTYVRMAMYMDPLVPYLPELKERGKLIYPVGEGKINYISRADIAKGVVALLQQPGKWGQRYLLAGYAYTMRELADILSEVADSPIQYDPVTREEFGEMYDEPQGFGPLLASMYQAGEMGLLDQTSDDFERLTGERPMPFKDYLKQHYTE
ncbi:SDR family oxidoreductase [Staphylococcus pettenkoferi]|uniref:SDR family oxidoreductase n=1 Tax=Staphylococcus pettenkoferi TaxID=170573 RepID=UPI0011A3F8B3|nr:SDR family oxidoreductase [Staphylococcus pettenkoferi]MCY1591287.1 SDR family oxidoreductase [Staphylococcus pettenkoferi]MCY1593523.1 SDR family oxidoreductase [Staphylococcus pettenkoferi]MCY1598220.1 SDR family oxidoreductase [Staphylococcus pettenkoferi]MCY1600488.1 SDR family oxidoreductase [Staphylococcus pettenkoferi]MCY1609581.1 SDR family oxidoreductase [Staphylococcus pettenkoferi]